MSLPLLPRRRADAVSLTETLVLLLVFAFLAALLLPALSNARSKAGVIGCLTHLRAFGAAFHAFAGDHNGLLPQDEAPLPPSGTIRNWPHHVGSYLSVQYGTFSTASNETIAKSPFYCPAEKEVVKPWISYSINRELNLRLFGQASYIRLPELASPAHYVLLADSHAYFYIPSDSRKKMTEWAGLTRRHNGQPNFLYADGHAAPFTEKLLGLSDAGGNAPLYRSLWQARYRP
ncbi:MAG TPA: hypothetical protein VNQ90_20800 [Chthoniobacteraceae bacterium]|nr:hypothetical protein [Chthoniobacteraceae bacterium]